MSQSSPQDERKPALAAPDGSPVEFYALLPPGEEPALIHDALPPGAAILELGCGAGRVTHALVALGHAVTAVDQSAEMLAHVHGAETVLADIETLDLRRRFAGVVLASNLVNTPDDRRRAAFLRTCRRHVADDGVVIIERLDPNWANVTSGSAGEWNGVRSTIRDLRHDGRLFTAVMDYELDGRRWTHPFTERLLDDDELAAELAAAGLMLRRWLDAERRWLVAAPARTDP